MIYTIQSTDWINNKFNNKKIARHYSRQNIRRSQSQNDEKKPERLDSREIYNRNRQLTKAPWSFVHWRRPTSRTRWQIQHKGSYHHNGWTLWAWPPKSNFRGKQLLNFGQRVSGTARRAPSWRLPNGSQVANSECPGSPGQLRISVEVEHGPATAKSPTLSVNKYPRTVSGYLRRSSTDVALVLPPPTNSSYSPPTHTFPTHTKHSSHPGLD